MNFVSFLCEKAFSRILPSSEVACNQNCLCVERKKFDTESVKIQQVWLYIKFTCQQMMSWISKLCKNFICAHTILDCVVRHWTDSRKNTFIEKYDTLRMDFSNKNF